jgi:hypothetical protein
MKRILVLATIAIGFTVPSADTLAVARATEDIWSTADYHLGGRTGFYLPTEEAINDYYEGGLSFEGEMVVWLTKISETKDYLKKKRDQHYGMSVSIERFVKSTSVEIPEELIGTVTDAKVDISVVPVIFTFLMTIPKQMPSSDNYLYIGGGIGVYQVSTDVSASGFGGFTTTESLSGSPLGWHLVAGMQSWTYPASWVVEARYSNSSGFDSGSLGKYINRLNLAAGLRYSPDPNREGAQHGRCAGRARAAQHDSAPARQTDPGRLRAS